jgi:RNA polymerase sigma-70 factor (ECF subfamily)
VYEGDEPTVDVEGRPLEEAELVDRARRGDMEAYDGLVRLYSDVAFRTAYLITGSAADAEDAAQDAFVAAFRALPRFQAGSPLRPWLLRIVANQARNRRRGTSRRAGLSLRLVDTAHRGDAAPSPELVAELAEERRALLRALDTLRARDREVVVCRFFLDLSVGQTARALACREGTVKSRLSRALGQLRTQLGDSRD